MKSRYPLWLALVASLGLSHTALAQLRCDCTRVVDSCEADVAVRGNWVEITTDHQQCARVDYFIDGLPFVSLVVDGEGREDWNAVTRDPRVLVQSCQVCSENPSASASTSARPAAALEPPRPGGTAGEASARLEPLIQVRPAYPQGAASLGVSGFVELAVTVGAGGEVEIAAVTAAEPAGVFDQAALAAISRWRYPAEQGREAQAVTERIEFRAPPPPAFAPAEAAPAAGERGSSSARNQCVRQGAVFNYGQMIEVALLNACDAPLLVFGCAQGTGRYQGRWVCTTSEQQQTVLVRAGDARIGETAAIDTGEGVLALELTDRFFVSRAPNSEYWWLACAVDDADCGGRAVQWTRALDRQLASVDPQGRSSLTLARSY